MNSGFFSAACWGVASHAIAIGMIFFALAALADTSSRWRWLRVVLAGLAVGMSVTEGADIGALFSLYVAAFVVYQAWLAEGPRARNLAVGLARVALVAVCAAWLAAAAISGLVATEIKGVAGAQQDAQTKQERWDWATQLSLPKWETLSLVVPGLFGYRMDTPDGGEYWGAVGRAPAWDRYFENGRARFAPEGIAAFLGWRVLRRGARCRCSRFGLRCNPCAGRTPFSACSSASCSGSGWGSVSSRCCWPMAGSPRFTA